MTEAATQPKRRGRPPAAPGTARDARVEIRTTTDRKAKAERLAAAAGLTLSAWWEQRIDSARER